MPSPEDVKNSLSTGHAVAGLLIVARSQRELYHALQQAFGDSPEVAVILDRRRENRRRQGVAVSADRRRMERRSLPQTEDDLQLRHYVLVRPHSRRPHD